MRQVPILLTVAALLAACAPHDAPTASRASETMRADAGAANLSADVIRTQLERAADGLLYTSESDYPFTWYLADRLAPSPLTEQGFRAAAQLADAAEVQVITLDAFFARHIENIDPNDSVQVALVPRYRHLRETIRRTIPDVRVYRVGRIAIDCYIVGTDAQGHVLGLTTISIET